MKQVIFETEEAVFQFDRKHVKRHLKFLEAEHGIEAVTKLLEFISTSSNTIIIPKEHSYFGYVTLDLISNGEGSVICKACNQTYQSRALKSFRVGHLSASSIGDYIECGLLYKFGRIDRLPMDFRSDALEFGTVIHLVLGEYYYGKQTENELTLKDILQSFEEYWRSKAEGNDEIQYSKDNTFESLLLQGKELLTVWFNKKTEDNFKILGIEETFSFDIDGIEVPIIGAMDLIEEDGPYSAVSNLAEYKRSMETSWACSINGVINQGG